MRIVVPEPPALVWPWSLVHILDKIDKAQECVMISTTAFTLQPVIEMLKSSQADEKPVLVGRHDFRRVQTWILAAVRLVKEVVGTAVVENRRDQADTLRRSAPVRAGE
jgi:hypothetical protein